VNNKVLGIGRTRGKPLPNVIEDVFVYTSWQTLNANKLWLNHRSSKFSFDSELKIPPMDLFLQKIQTRESLASPCDKP